MGRNYWMVVSPPEDFEVTKERGFGVFGVRAKYRRRSQRMQPDDRMLFYVSGIRKWAATATVVSGSFEDRTPIWKPNRKSEVFPYRVKLKPTMVLNEDDYIDALWLAPSLEYVKRWAPEDWPLAFFDTLHLLPQKDFKLIEGEMVRLATRNNGYRKSSGLTAPSGWSSHRAEDRTRAEYELDKSETSGQSETGRAEQHDWSESAEAEPVHSEADDQSDTVPQDESISEERPTWLETAEAEPVDSETDGQSETGGAEQHSWSGTAEAKPVDSEADGQSETGPRHESISEERPTWTESAETESADQVATDDS